MVEIKFGFLRQDDDSHWYLIPSEKLLEYDNLVDRMESGLSAGKEAFELENDFIEKFDQYRVGGSLYGLRVVIE